MREIVSVPVTVHVCRSDACGDRMRRRLPTVEIFRGSAVGGLVRLGGPDGVRIIIAVAGCVKDAGDGTCSTSGLGERGQFAFR